MADSQETLDEPLYQIVFCGSLTGEFEVAEAKSRFQKLFKLKDKQIEKLFSGKEHVIKSHLPEDRAMSMAIRIIETGCECEVEIIPDLDDISLQPGFVEHRKAIRRLRYRRDPRPGVIVPDRRDVSSRRKMDLVLLQRDGDFPGNSIAKKK